MEHLKYPYGKFEYGKTYSEADTKKNIVAIEALPAELNALAAQFTETLLEKSYRPGGWNARQVIHHIADSHSNALIRVKSALTENAPIIKPYDQDGWCNLADAREMPVRPSLLMIEAIHERWVYLLKHMQESDFKRTYIHPEYNREYSLSEFVALYAWHGKQHCGHLQIILNEQENNRI